MDFIDVNTFLVVCNNKPVIATMNKFQKRKRATSISNFDSHTNLPHYKLLMVLNRLRDNYFDGGEKNSYGARCVKSIKDNVICLNKYQVKDAVAYLFLIVISQLALSLPTRLLVFVWGLISFFGILVFYFIIKVSG